VRRYEERRRRGRTGKERTSPGVAKTFRRRGRRKIAEPVLLLAGLGKGVTAARPLDGGTLTRWGARTPARGPAAVPWMPASLHHSLSSGSVLLG